MAAVMHKAIRISEISVKHLPKMDTFGKCDPVIHISFKGDEKSTKPVKSVYEATWEDKFDFELSSVFSGMGDFLMTLFDWEMMGANKRIGEVRLREERMAKLCGEAPGFTLTEELPVMDGDKHVKGKDKEQCSIQFKFELLDRGVVKLSEAAAKGSTVSKMSAKDFVLGDILAPVDADPEAEGERMIKVTVVNARSLPKMDAGFLGMGGKVDAYCELDLGGVKYKTEVQKSNYSPDWESTFSFSATVGHAPSPLSLKVLDWNLTGDPDFVGEVIVSRDRLNEMLKAKDGWTGTDTFVIQKEGNRVMGHDKKSSVLTLKFEILVPVPAFSDFDIHEGAQGPRLLEMTIVNARNLPKVDTLGTIDAFVEMIYEGETSKTGVVKNSLDPDFEKVFEVGITKVEEGCSADVVLRLYDWNMTSASELVGEARISASRMSELLRAKIGSEGVERLILTNKGRPVQGKNLATAEISIKLRILDAPLMFGDILPEDAAQGPRRLEVNVFKCEHLPAMDGMFGKCDGYAVLSFDGCDYKTKTIKNSYTAEWDELFSLDCDKVDMGTKSNVVVTVWDWDATSGDDRIGSFQIPSTRLCELFRGAVGSTAEHTFTLMEDNKPVVGHDKHKCEVTLKLKVSEVPIAFPTISPRADVKGPRRLQLTIFSVSDLPKMDGIFGKCDPYSVLLWEAGAECGRTEIKKGTYDAEWNETFNLDLEDATRGTSADCIVSVWDWDTASADDEIGSVKISAQRISDLFRANLGSMADHTFTVMSEGKPVIGHSKSKCEMILKVRVCEVPLAFPALIPQPGVKGPRRLEVTMVKVASCPKMDGLLGKCDPYAKLMFQDVEYKTTVVKNTYDAEWMDTFNFDVDDACKNIPFAFVVSLWDFDTASKDDEIGSFSISAARVSDLFRASLGSVAEASFLVLDAGKPVLGHDKKRCEVTMRVKVCEVPIAFPMIEQVSESKGPRRLDLTVCSVNCLPNMDGLFGKCDPYAILMFEGIEYRTETRKNTYDASYEETFSLDVEDAAVGVRSDLAVTVWDWDATSQDDLVGSVKISSARVSEMLRGSLGVNGQHTFNVISKGIPVVGHNKDMCTLTLYAKVCEVPLAFSSILPEGEASGPRRLEVTLSSVKHLPKMDGILGKCDPYATLCFGGVDYRTETKKNAYEAEWNETFNLDCDDVRTGTRSDIKATVWDWDAASADDQIGSALISTARLNELFRGSIGSSGEHTFTVMAEGKPVIGNDRQKCELTMKVKVSEVPIAFPSVEPKKGVKGPRRIIMTLEACKHLPAMDGMFGKCDAYAILSFENMEHQTDVVKNSYEADWNEQFELDLDDAAIGTRSQCLVTLMDWDKVTKDDEIGTFKISAARMSDLFRGELDQVCEDTFTVMSAGHPVVGHDKLPCQVTVKVQVANVPVIFPLILPGQDVSDPRRLELTVVSATHLPKADVGSGTCDPFLKLSFNGVEFTTDTKRNTLTAEWNHKFDLDDVIDKTKGANTDLQCTLWDWDMMTKNDVLGSFKIKAARMNELFSGPLGGADEHTFNIVQNSRYVEGHDGHRTEILLRVKVCVNPVEGALDEAADAKAKTEATTFVIEEVEDIPVKKVRKPRPVRKAVREAKVGEPVKSWWDDHPPMMEPSDLQGAVLGDKRSSPETLIEEPRQGMRVEEVTVARSGGGGGTIISVTSLRVRMQKSFRLPGGLARQRAGGADDAEAEERRVHTWAVCVDWDIGLTHIYHAKSDGTFNLRLLGGKRRMQGAKDDSLRDGMTVELSQEGRDWYLTNSPTSVGLSGRGRVLRAFESNCEVLWSASCAAMRVPNRFLVQRRTSGAKGLRKRVDDPVLSQSKTTSGSGGDVAVVRVECSTEGAVIRYAMDKPSAPGLLAAGTSSLSLSGHAGWTVYQGPLHIPLEQRGQGSGHDTLLKVCATKEGFSESKVVGWVVQKGHLARWEQPSPIWSTPHNLYQFDTPSKFRVWPPRPATSSSVGGPSNFSETSYARARPVSTGMKAGYRSGVASNSMRRLM